MGNYQEFLVTEDILGVVSEPVIVTSINVHINGKYFLGKEKLDSVAR